MISNKYRIKMEDNDIKPEETLMDSLSEHTSVELPIGSEVFSVAYIIFFLIFAVFLGKAFQLQVLKGLNFAALVERSSSTRFTIPGPRGLIYDRNGNQLVENVPVFDVFGISPDLPKDASSVSDLTSSLGNIISMPAGDISNLISENRGNASFTIKRGLTKEEVVKINSTDLPGIYVGITPQRHYLQSEQFSSVIGYTSKVNQKDLENDSYYILDDTTGRFGLESEYENNLRGGHVSISKDASGALNQKESDSDMGDSLTLTIDKDVQDHLFQSIKDVFSSGGVQRGAAVVSNVKTGAILGMVSYPSFDANLFENYFDKASSDKLSKILTDQNRPLFNRIISGRYSPGSTIKPLLALAGLKEKVVTPNTKIDAEGSITVPSIYDPSVVYTFRDWKVHGITDVRKAIADSVDVYFYALGGGYGPIKGLGANRVVSYFKSFLADKSTGIDLPGEVSGFVPSPEWKKSVRGEDWYVGDTYNISIGQGDMQVTPIWLSTYVSALANGGTLYRPYIVQEIKNNQGKLVQNTQPQVLGSVDFSSDVWQVVHEGMRQTITDGTASLLKDLPVAVAAKTGTAQVTGRGLNSLFIVYGPYDNPDISVTVLVENINQSQGLAIRVANEFLLWYFGEH